MAAEHHTVLVLDYGSQYTQLIARRVREIGVFSVLFPGDASLVSDEKLYCASGTCQGVQDDLCTFALARHRYSPALYA
jgi:GMP synthase-like glutamine amidotransferase